MRMQATIDRVMRAYVLMVALTQEDESNARERLEEHLTKIGGDEKTLTVEGIRFLRASNHESGRRSPTPGKPEASL
jgi:hypothetical protein